MTPADTLELGPIGQIAHYVADIDRSVAFYRDVLRLKFIAGFPNLAFFDCDGVRLMLSSGREADKGSESVLYFRVPSIREAYDALSARGVEFTHKPLIVHSNENYELWMAFFEDPDGHTVAIMDERGSLSADS